MYRSFIGLGSNLALHQHGRVLTPDQLLKAGAATIAEQFSAQAYSSVFISQPLGPQDQPHFYNAVIAVTHDCEPLVLLRALQHIEQQFGRVRQRHWGERTLDLDVLCSYSVHNNKPVAMVGDELTVPHTGILQRSFVYVPLLEIDATLSLDEAPIMDRVSLDTPLRAALQSGAVHWPALKASLETLLLRHCYNSRWLSA